MVLPLPEDGKGMLSADAAEVILGFAAGKADVIAIGPGLGVSEGTEKIMSQLVQKSAVPMVIDADGINAMALSVKRQASSEILKKAKAPVILTPHPGEMARLLKSSAEVRKSGSSEGTDKISTSLLFSKATGTYVVLKGAPTVIAGPEGRAFINVTGNPGMATAGSGDVLTGLIASLAGQGLSPLEASTLGVYLHGTAGDLAAREKGEPSLIASDIIEFLPEAFSRLDTA